MILLPGNIFCGKDLQTFISTCIMKSRKAYCSRSLVFSRIFLKNVFNQNQYFFLHTVFICQLKTEILEV